MNAPARIGQWTRMSAGLIFLCTLSAHAAAENLWYSSIGKSWFYESRSWSNQELAGTWWEGSLTPGTYEISFEVTALNGKVGLFIGSGQMKSVDRTGWHTHEFKVWDGGERRMMFTTLENKVSAGVAHIKVQRKWSGGDSGDSGGGSSGDSVSGGTSGNWLPKGHYWTFSRERNLKQEMLDIIDAPWKAQSDWHRKVAQDLHTAMRTPGVKGFGMRLTWRQLEPSEGQYNWSVMDANMEVARRLGLKFFVQVGYRSFNGSDNLPYYFPSQYKRWSGDGYVAKLWDPWVYNRLIRLHQQIAWRYNDDPAFGGIGSTETALGQAARAGDYSYWQYRTALIEIANKTQAALKQGRFFWYLNFVEGGLNYDMRKDGRVNLVNSVSNNALVVGGPDITPDAAGMPGSVNSYRVHLRDTRPDVLQFCNAQHADQGERGIPRKSNQRRHEYLNKIQQIRNQEKQSWYSGLPAILTRDTLNPSGSQSDLHPDWAVGQQWKPDELLQFADRNFGCDYFLWHYRENVFNDNSQYWWYDIQPVIKNNQYFYQ